MNIITVKNLCKSYKVTKRNSGFKNAFSIDEVWTGRDFCTELGIDYDEIINQRKNDAIDNYNFVLDALAEMEDVQNRVFEKAHIVIDENGAHFIEH